MSKAFTRESDDLPERPAVPRPPPALPPGTRNYLTPRGAKRLREELEQLLLPGAKAEGPARIEARLAVIQRCLQTAEIVPPPPPPHDQVRFGARVTVRDHLGVQEQFQIVGVDEADPEQDAISWLSPLARALANSRLGERVRLKLPGGDRELEIVAIAFDPE